MVYHKQHFFLNFLFEDCVIRRWRHTFTCLQDITFCYELNWLFGLVTFITVAAMSAGLYSTHNRQIT